MLVVVPLTKRYTNYIFMAMEKKKCWAVSAFIFIIEIWHRK